MNLRTQQPEELILTHNVRGLAQIEATIEDMEALLADELAYETQEMRAHYLNALNGAKRDRCIAKPDFQLLTNLDFNGHLIQLFAKQIVSGIEEYSGDIKVFVTSDTTIKEYSLDDLVAAFKNALTSTKDESLQTQLKGVIRQIELTSDYHASKKASRPRRLRYGKAPF